MVHGCTFFVCTAKEHICTLWDSIVLFRLYPKYQICTPRWHKCTFLIVSLKDNIVPSFLYPKDHFCTLVAQLYLFDCTSKITNMYTLKRFRIGTEAITFQKHNQDSISDTFIWKNSTKCQQISFFFYFFKRFLHYFFWLVLQRLFFLFFFLTRTASI